MQNITFEVKSENTETDKSSTIGSPLNELEAIVDAEAKRKLGGPRCKYGKPTKEDRQALIHKIIHEGLSIRQAAKKTAINYSTAKSIFNLYKNEGRLGNDLAKDDEEEDNSAEDASATVTEQSASSLLSQALTSSSWYASQFPQKKQFQEETVKRKDPFTCLLYQQLNTVESKPRGFFTTDSFGSQPNSLLSSAFCVYTPPKTNYSTIMVAPTMNQQPTHFVLNSAQPAIQRPRFF